MNEPFVITNFGINTPHDPKFVFNHPYGLDAYLLMCFATPFVAQTVHGIEIGQPGDCILLNPGFPQYHGTPEGMVEGFRNDWIFFMGVSVAEIANHYDVPLNTLISTGKPHLLEPYLRSIGDELSMHRPFWEEKSGLLIEELLLQVGRHLHLATEFRGYTPTERDLRERFLAARISIHSQYDRSWDVKQMSELVSLSPERFWVLYKKFFQISPKDDLISKRLDEAKIRLLNSFESVEVIARQCGFNSLYYFSRLFKKRIGCTPSEYRNRLGG